MYMYICLSLSLYIYMCMYVCIYIYIYILCTHMHYSMLSCAVSYRIIADLVEVRAVLALAVLLSW